MVNDRNINTLVILFIHELIQNESVLILSKILSVLFGSLFLAAGSIERRVL